MRRLLLSLLAMVALIGALDQAVGRGLEALFHASSNPTDGDVLGRAWEMQPPIVVCGSSRASHHYVSDSLASWAGAPVFNLGRDGSFGPAYQYGCAGILLRHYTPGLWIMEVDDAVMRGPELTDRLSCFLPWSRSEPAARELVLRRSRYEPIRLLSRIYPFNSLVLRLAAPFVRVENSARLGFLPLSGTFRPGAPEPDPGTTLRTVAGRAGAREPAESLKLRDLRATVQLLHSRGVRVVAVRSPRYLLSPAAVERDTADARELEETFGSLGVRFLDFSAAHMTRYADPALFRDPSHLNETGALLFSREMADSLRTLGLLQRPGSPTRR